MKTTLLIFCVMMSLQVMAQTNTQAPCSSPEAHQFDFWIGDWNITYGDTMHAANHV
jgi:hypothetical protein